MSEERILQKLNEEVLALEKEHDDYLDDFIKAYKEGASTAEFLLKKENRNDDTLCWLLCHTTNDVAPAAKRYHEVVNRLHNVKELIKRIQS